MLTGLMLLQNQLETALAAAKKAATEATHHAEAITNAAESQQASFVARLKQLSMQVPAPALVCSCRGQPVMPITDRWSTGLNASADYAT